MYSQGKHLSLLCAHISEPYYLFDYSNITFNRYDTYPGYYMSEVCYAVLIISPIMPINTSNFTFIRGN